MMLQSHYKLEGAALLETRRKKLSGDVVSFSKNMAWEEVALFS